MFIVLMASGTRGDVQPMLSLGKALVAAGHRVRIVAGSNFAAWILSHGLEFWPTIDVEALMRSELGIAWVEGTNQFTQMRAMVRLMDSAREPSVNDAIRSTEGADLIITGFVMEPLMQAVQERRGVRVITAALQPYRPTARGQSSMVPLLRTRDSVLNRWWGHLAQRLMLSLTWKSVVLARERLGLRAHTPASLAKAVRAIPALYAISPEVTPATVDTNAVTVGYWFLDETFIPSAALATFLAGGDRPVYVGFGSMPNSDPARTVTTVANALAASGQRGILARGWSGTVVTNVPSHLFLLDAAPHDWLFPRMRAVVHHGGAGTTAAGLRAGCPSLLIPHMADQYYWSRRVHELGVGPVPLHRRELDAHTLGERIATLTRSESIRTRAGQLGEKITREDGIARALDWIHRFMAW